MACSCVTFGREARNKNQFIFPAKENPTHTVGWTLKYRGFCQSISQSETEVPAYYVIPAHRKAICYTVCRWAPT